MNLIFILPTESVGWGKTDGLGGLTRFGKKVVFGCFMRLKGACGGIRNLKDQDTSVIWPQVGLPSRAWWGCLSASLVLRADAGSFDSARSFACERSCCAQDDSSGWDSLREPATALGITVYGWFFVLRAFSPPTLPHRTRKSGAPSFVYDLDFYL